MKTKTATPDNQSSRFNKNQVHHNITVMFPSASPVKTDFTVGGFGGYAAVTATHLAGRCGNRLSKGRTSATITAGAFFSSVDPVAAQCGQSQDWSVPFCTDFPPRIVSASILAWKRDEAVNPKQLENRNHG